MCTHAYIHTPSRLVRTPSLSSMLHPLRVAPSRFTLGMCTHCSMAPYSGNTGLVRFPLARHCYTVTHYTGIVIHTALTPYNGIMGLLRFPLGHHSYTHYTDIAIHPPSPPLLYTLHWLPMMVVSNRLVPHATSEGFLIFSFTMEVCITDYITDKHSPLQSPNAGYRQITNCDYGTCTQSYCPEPTLRRFSYLVLLQETSVMSGPLLRSFSTLCKNLRVSRGLGT